MHLSTSSRASDRHLRAFREYAQWNQRDGAELFIGETRKYAVELYVQTEAVSPTKAEIAADVRALGWKIPAFFADGRIGRGLPRMWADFIQARKEKGQRRRGRPTKGTAEEREEQRAKVLNRPTLAQMQAFVIAVRNRARLYLASGWLGAIADLGGTPPSSLDRRGELAHRSGVTSARGGATIRRSAGRVEIDLWNETPHIVAFDQEHQIVERARAARALDLYVYIRRKQAEAAAQIFRAAA